MSWIHEHVDGSLYSDFTEHDVSRVALLWGWLACLNGAHEYLVCEAHRAPVSGVVNCHPQLNSCCNIILVFAYGSRTRSQKRLF